ncbi:conserved Plasmodium protein, unknown function [Plasmodium ovale wallikeri]|uniref:Uncharacterized protein n=1 Tax=Plasmodium ovale wallikeri TaxID=864142 RepID=A0A1A8YK00_PLAOA|nr:conserved Plasmodium protein, unknown function [Plasmodium ovale wallikeri]
MSLVHCPLRRAFFSVECMNMSLSHELFQTMNERERARDFFLQNAKCNERREGRNSKTVKQINIDKCEQASILLDNLSTFECLNSIDEKKYFTISQTSNLILSNVDIDKCKNFPICTDSSNTDSVFDLYKIRETEKFSEEDRDIHGCNISHGEINFPEEGEDNDQNYHFGSKFTENAYDCSYKKDITRENMMHLLCKKQVEKMVEELDREKYTQHCRKLNSDTHDNIEAGTFFKKKNNKDKYIFNLKSGRKEIDGEKEQQCHDSSQKKIKIISKRNCEGRVNYEKRLKEKMALHEEEREKLKTEFDMKINEMVEKYKTEEVKKKKLIYNIYNKYMNIKNNLLKKTCEMKTLEEENKKLKNEIKESSKYPLENDIVRNYKDKLEDYIYLNKNKDIKIKNLENELKSVRKSTQDLEKKLMELLEERRKLQSMNTTFAQDNRSLQKCVENLTCERDQMGEILFYKEMKINYFMNILNVLDETVLGEGEHREEAQGGNTGVTTNNGDDSATDTIKKAIGAQTGSKMDDAIKTMNKKIMVKSIVHKIKEINRKIEKHNSTIGGIENKENYILHNEEHTTGKKSNNDTEEKKCNNKMLDSYFNCTNFVLNENYTNLCAENETLITFFTNGDLEGANKTLENNHDLLKAEQGEENSTIVLNRQEN